MFSNLGGWTGVILLVVILLVFAAPKLPMFAKNLSQSIRIFKDEMKSPESTPSAGQAPSESAPSADAAPTTTAETPSNGTTPNSTNQH